MFLAVQDSSIGYLVTESLSESSFDFRVTMTTLTTMNTMTTMTTMKTMTAMDSVTSLSTETAI